MAHALRQFLRHDKSGDFRWVGDGIGDDGKRAAKVHVIREFLAGVRDARRKAEAVELVGAREISSRILAQSETHENILMFWSVVPRHGGQVADENRII